MNILITGTNGFIGSWIVNRLQDNHNIIGCGTKEKSSSSVKHYVKWIIGHEEIPKELLNVGIDVVIHAASVIDEDDDNIELSYANLLGTHQIIKLCKKIECKMAILISSIPIVGNPGNEIIRETSIPNPPTMYHATKAAQELMFYQLKKRNIRNVILRIPSPIAPIMQKKTIFTTFMEKAMRNENIIINGKGSRRQNYIDVRDIAQVVERILIASEAQGIYNIASNVTVSNAELADKCVRISESNSKILYSGEHCSDDNQVWNIDISKLKREIGFVQEFTIEQTISDYIKENYKADLSLESLAEIFGYSPAYLSKMLKRYAGINYKAYLQNVRLEHAYQELVNSEQSISSIAMEHGFASSKAFTRAFQGKYGMPPSKYRGKRN